VPIGFTERAYLAAKSSGAGARREGRGAGFASLAIRDLGALAPGKECLRPLRLRTQWLPPRFKGSLQGRDNAHLGVRANYDNDPGITLEIRNQGHETSRVRIYNAYTKETIAHHLRPDRDLVWHWSLDASFGWYDLTIEVESDSSFRQRLAGHVETGKDSMSDPALGA
jgi:hypothetical protein